MFLFSLMNGFISVSWFLLAFARIVPILNKVIINNNNNNNNNNNYQSIFN